MTQNLQRFFSRALVRSTLWALLLVVGVGMPVSVLAQNAVPEVRFTIDRFEIEGENPLSRRKTRGVLSSYVGEHVGLERLLEAREALEDAIVESGFPFHRVVLPPQTLKGRIVTIQIVAFRVGQVEVEGNERFNYDNIRRSLPALQEGATPGTRRIARQLQLAKAHPSKAIKTKFSQSRVPDQIDATISVTDSRPYLLFTSFSNTGSEQSGEDRWSVGLQHNNLFNRDHIVTVSYTTSFEEIDDVMQYGINYRVPLYSVGANLSAFYTDSTVETGQAAGLDVKGVGRMAGLRGEYLFLNLGRYSHSLTLGLDDKVFENNITIPGISSTDSDVRSRPVSLKYQGGYKGVNWGGRFNASFAMNIDSGGNNNDVAYGAVRSGADASWSAFRYGVGGEYLLPGNWELRGRVQGQFAQEELISGEQFGLGGVSSVRGYEEREVLGDTGMFLSTEVWTPPLTRLALRFLAFADYGFNDIENPLLGQDDGITPASVGLGLRYTWRKNVTFSVDWGYALDDATDVRPIPSSVTESGDNKAHLNLFVRF